ncbi:MAG TPA: condensation domain-containing protein, partial [Pyrinomonadaceae bacterium]|nr:condensation domain-containing protein [Pyrinomonadaceae bacterium]
MSDSKESLAGFELSAEQQRLLARLLKEEGIESAKSQRTIPRDGSVSEKIPLSFAQQRLWLLEQLEPGTSLYHIPVTLRLTGPLDRNALQQALTEIVRRHEVLRTRLEFCNGEPVQVIAPQATWEVLFEDLTNSSDAEKEAQSSIERLAHEPFDLCQGRPIRAKLLRLAEDNHLLAIVMHHIASDGWSYGILFKELSSLYTAFSQGKSSPLPDLPVQYADYAIQQRDWLQGEALTSRLDYWKQRLRGAPELLELPTDYQRPAKQSLSGGRQQAFLPAELVADLENLSRREGVTLFMTLLAAVKLLLYRHTGQPDVVVGIPSAGRSRTEFENLIGFFINTLVLRTDLSGNVSFRELIRRVRAVCIGAYDHQEMPFEKLVEELQPQRSLNHTPLFQVFVNMFALSDGLPEFPGLKVTALTPPEIGSKFDLTFYIQHYHAQLMITLAYNKALFA